MPKFSQTSLKRLATCHPDLRFLFMEVIKTFDCTVLEGYRDREAQEAAFKAGNSKLHYPFGKHNSVPSLAVDVAPYPIDWNNAKRFYWFAGYVMGIADRLKLEGEMLYKVRFGGDWDRDYDITNEKGLRDLVHFELTT
jgi:peptidoglycan LD-endopeptidase CwlK